MVNQQVLAGKWNEVSGKIKEKWGKLSDDDLRTFNGNVDQLVGQIQRKTGETRQVIEEFLGEVADETSAAAAALRDKVHECRTARPRPLARVTTPCVRATPRPSTIQAPGSEHGRGLWPGRRGGHWHRTVAPRASQ